MRWSTGRARSLQRLVLRLCLVATCVPTYACEDDIGYVDPVEEANYELYDRTYQNGKPHGTWTYYYSDGTVWRVVDFNEGLRNGIEVSWYPTGAMEYEGHWVNDLRDGAWRAYDEQGALCAESLLTLGSGTLVRCHGNGQISESSQWVSGTRDGVSTTYDLDGAIETSATYQLGLLHGPHLYSDGEVTEESSYVMGALDGPWTLTYVSSGALAGRGNYSQGIPVGLVERWHENGALMETYTFDAAGVAQGPHLRYFDDGQLALEEHFVDGVQHGRYLSFYDNGQPSLVGAYLFGQQDGLWEFYLSSGMPDSFVEFDNGIQLGVSVTYGAAGIDTLYYFDLVGASDTPRVDGMSLQFHGGGLAQLCRESDGDRVQCIDLDSGRDGISADRLVGSWTLTQQDAQPTQTNETLTLTDDGTGSIGNELLSFAFDYVTKGPLIERTVVGTETSRDAFYVDGDTLYLLRATHFWQYQRQP